MQLSGDYGRSGSGAPRQAALQRFSPGAIGSGLGLPAASAPSYTSRPASITAGPSGRYSRPVPPPVEQPGPIDPNAWLGSDTGYQDQLRQLQLAMSNMNADVTRRQGSVNSDYASSEHALQDQKVQDLHNMESDWSGRGLIRSGLYANAVGNYNKEFDQRASDLVSSRDKTLAQLLQEQNAFQTQQGLDQQAARESALRRRASGLGTVA